MLYSLFFVIGFVTGIAVTIVLLNLAIKFKDKPAEIKKKKDQEHLNQVIHMTPEREELLNQAINSDL